jgi:hypothetical protein
LTALCADFNFIASPPGRFSEPRARQGRRGNAMAVSIADIKNWMHLFRWIVKLIRDEYGIEEKILTRTVVLEEETGLTTEQLEGILDYIAEAFEVTFPADVLSEVVTLEDLCMLVAWFKGMYKKPDFVTPGFETACREANVIPD